MERITYASNDERTWAMLCHLSALAGYIIPFGNFIAPLVIWIIKKDEYAEVNKQGKDALNFQLSMLIYLIIGGILTMILVGFLVLLALAIFNLVVIITATVKSNNGERYTYPLALKIIS